MTVPEMQWPSSTSWNTIANFRLQFWNHQIPQCLRIHRLVVFCINGTPPIRKSLIKLTAWNWCRALRAWAAFRLIKVWALDGVRWFFFCSWTSIRRIFIATKSIYFNPIQITAVCILNDIIYIGTSWGCLIVADQTTLAPVTVFRPFEEEVQYIAPLPTTDINALPAIVSIGKGYRSLINRYTDIDSPAKRANDKERRIHQTHCILWRAEHWTPI